MSSIHTAKLLSAYVEESSAPMFLSGEFQTTPEHIHDTEMIEIDIVRDDEDIAIAITDLSTGARLNESSRYVNKGFTPPIFDEAGAINSGELLRRFPGALPTQDPNFAVAATEAALRMGRQFERKIRRSIELMASQVLQTGTVTLTNAAGTALYTLNYQAKATHFYDVGVTWSLPGVTETGSRMADIDAMAQVIRRDGKKNPYRLAFGATAIQRFLAGTDVANALKKEGLGLGALSPQVRGEGATFVGYIWIGSYMYEVWLYDGFYRNPVTGNLTPYIGDDNMIMLSRGARLDLSFGSIPLVARPESRALPYLPTRVSSPGRSMDLTFNSWITPDNKSLMVSVGTRPLPIPTAVDTFGCLTTVHT